jgi:kinesin family protein 5
MEFLTRNLDQLAIVQKQLVEQNSNLKKEVAVAEKRLLARNERITNLETLLQDAQEKLNTANSNFDAQMQNLREKMDQARLQHKPLIMAGALNLGNRIAKPLRGGGGGANGQGPEGPSAAVGKSLDAKRSSWFFNS